MWAPDVTDREAELVLQELSHDLMSPFCPGRTIASCPSKNARKLEDRILEDAKSGKSREQIEQTLVADYGSDIIGYRPPLSLLVSTVVGGLLALSLLLYMGRRWVRGNRGGGGSDDIIDGAVAAAGARRSGSGLSVAEKDALEDALDEEDGF